MHLSTECYHLAIVSHGCEKSTEAAQISQIENGEPSIPLRAKQSADSLTLNTLSGLRNLQSSRFTLRFSDDLPQ